MYFFHRKDQEKTFHWFNELLLHTKLVSIYLNVNVTFPSHVMARRVDTIWSTILWAVNTVEGLITNCNTQCIINLNCTYHAQEKIVSYIPGYSLKILASIVCMLYFDLYIWIKYFTVILIQLKNNTLDLLSLLKACLKRDSVKF